METVPTHPIRTTWLRLAGCLAAATAGPTEAERHLQPALAEVRRSGPVDGLPELAGAVARLRLEQGDPDAAVRLTDEAAELIATKAVWIWAGEVAPVRVAALAATGACPEAARLVERFARGIRGRDAPAPRAALATCRAILRRHQGDPLPAAAAFDRAARAWDWLPRPYDAWLARESQAECLHRAGRTEEALTQLSRVRAGLVGLGARVDAHRVRQRVRELGGADEPARRGRRGYGDRLSPRELDVVELVVAGQTTQEIADALWKAPATVTEQLRSAMRKLDVSSRTALAVKAVELGLSRSGDGTGGGAGGGRPPAPPRG